MGPHLFSPFSEDTETSRVLENPKQNLLSLSKLSPSH